MKRIVRMLLVLSCSLVVLRALANPILDGYINELMFPNGKWLLEVHSHESSFDGWFLSSRSGGAAFKLGIALNGNYVLMTADSLMTPLTIDPNGDSLTLHSPAGPVVALEYGTQPHHVVLAPLVGQSICLQESEGFYYLDATPTPGLPNDSDGAMARIEGLVYDSLTGLPLANTSIWWGNYPPGSADSTGHFRFYTYARTVQIWFSHAGYMPKVDYLDLLPGYIYGVTIDMISTGQSVGPEGRASTFSIRQNYPNPFNPSTTILYSLSHSSHVNMVVYDLSGRLIVELVDAFQPPGEHRARWEGTDDAGGPLASGLYLVRIRVQPFGSIAIEQRTVKALLLR